jgi:thiol-disulfide isomerase/thioredoxin
VLGLILTSAAIHGANAGTTILLLAYAMGAATSLAAALLVGGKALGLMRTYLGADAWVRKILGTAVLVGVLAIALGWDRGTLTARSRLHAESLEQTLVQVFRPDTAQTASGTGAPAAEGVFPELDGAVAWINSPPLTPAALRGKVVLIDFWTYSCINCLRSLPYLQAWADKYRDVGLVVIGVHTPEFAFERDPANVGKAVQALGITYPVAIDSRYGIWNAFHNQYWPAHYLIDGSGVIRRHHFGEGEHEAAERTIQQLLGELHPAGGVPTGVVDVRGSGAGAPSQDAVAGSLETYIGYERSENMAVVPGLKRDRAAAYRLPAQLALNQWGLLGVWKVQAEDAALARAPGKIVFRFHARDLHLVLGPGAPGRPVHFIVRLDGQPPMKNHGTDTDASGRGVIRDQRLYQLIRQKTTTAIRDRTFEVEFRDPGVQAFAFTFG